jgi:hypothetical protein
MTDVPRTSLVACTRCPPPEPRLLSCCVCRPKSIAFTQPAGFAASAGGTVAYLSDLVESGLERTGDRPDNRLRHVGGLERVAERPAQ